MYDPKHRIAWDNKLMGECNSQATQHPNVKLGFYHYNSFLIFGMKEFCNKTCLFDEKGTIYGWATTNSLQDTEQPGTLAFPDSKQADRCDTITNIFRIARDPETCEIIVQTLAQMDNKTFWVPAWIMDSFAP